MFSVLKKICTYLYTKYKETIHIWKEEDNFCQKHFKNLKSVEKRLSYKCFNSTVAKNVLLPLSRKFDGI